MSNHGSTIWIRYRSKQSWTDPFSRTGASTEWRTRRKRVGRRTVSASGLRSRANSQHGGSRTRTMSSAGQASVDLSGYTVLRPLTTGGQSEAILVVRKQDTGRVFVAKRVSAIGPWQHHRAAVEKEILLCIKQRGHDCTNLNWMRAFFWNPSVTQLTLILEYCDGGDLYDLITCRRRQGRMVSEKFIWHATLSISKALMFLHYGKINPHDHVPNWVPVYHMDVHPTNIFLANENYVNTHPRVVLGDFGASVFKSDIRAGKDRGEVFDHPGWTAPECRANGYAGAKAVSDVWQLAGVCQALGRFVSIPDFHMGGDESMGYRYSARLNRVVGRMSAHNYQFRPNSRDIVVDLERR